MNLEKSVQASEKVAEEKSKQQGSDLAGISDAFIFLWDVIRGIGKCFVAIFELISGS